MRQNKASKRGRWLAILAAGGVGYLLGGWHTAMLRSTVPSPAQTVALRFPADENLAAAAGDTPVAPAFATETASGNILGGAQVVLFSPHPTVLPSAPRPDVEAAAALPEKASPALPPTKPKVVAPRPFAEAKAAAPTPAYRSANRPGFVLDDAQIASIKQRLRLTPDQERMWPAVEAALRNIAYERAREARRHSVPANGNAVASIDPNGAAAQDLKSAAIPLIMSFNDEQRNEVRSLAHVMGLDRLASEM
jgi:hypothetical protein